MKKSNDSKFKDWSDGCTLHKNVNKNKLKHFKKNQHNN